MKIRKLHIKNYKVFDDIELDFTDANGKTLDKIVLAGVNGCGKTTVLELILSIYNNYLSKNPPIDENTLIEIELELTLEEKKRAQLNVSKYLKNYNQPLPKIPYYETEEEKINSELRKLYTQLGSDKKYYTLKFNKKLSTVSYDSKVASCLLDRTNTISKNINLIYLPVKIEIKNTDESIKIIHLHSDKETMKTLALKNIRDEVFKNEDVTIRKSKEKAINRLQKPLNSLTLTTNLIDLESEELIFESANGQRIKFEDLSNGEQNLYFRAIYLSTLNPQNSIIMIDEPEDSLHPTWQQKVMQLYQNIGENNQVIVATHSPHIIGSSKAEEVFLLQIDAHQIEARHPKYTKGHSIDYVLDEIMGANSRDTSVINLVESYLTLMRKGLHETDEGLQIKANIDALNLDPNSEEMRRLDLSIKRIKAVGV